MILLLYVQVHQCPYYVNGLKIILILLILSLSISLNPQTDFTGGKTYDKIKSEGAEKWSYSLYLPKKYVLKTLLQNV